ncbi:endonuclease/Exonuclease/phosphatase family protein, partial [Vibrio parahaemolyticus VPTS-2010]
KSA